MCKMCYYKMSVKQLGLITQKNACRVYAYIFFSDQLDTTQNRKIHYSCRLGIREKHKGIRKKSTTCPMSCNLIPPL